MWFLWQWASLVAQMVKHLPAMWKTRVPWMEQPGGLWSMGLQSRTRLSDFTFTFFPLAIMFQDERHPKRERKGQRERNRLENDLGCPSQQNSQPIARILCLLYSIHTHSPRPSGSCPGLVTFLLSSQTPFLSRSCPPWTLTPQLCTKMLNKWGCISTLGPYVSLQLKEPSPQENDELDGAFL